MIFRTQSQDKNLFIAHLYFFDDLLPYNYNLVFNEIIVCITCMHVIILLL